MILSISDAAKLYGCTRQNIQDKLNRNKLGTVWKNKAVRYVEIPDDEFARLSSVNTCVGK